MSEPTTAPAQSPTVGRIVHFVLDTHADGSIREDSHGEHRPAIVVRVWSDVMVQLQVFTDGGNDRPNHSSDGLLWRTSVHQDEDTKAPGTWHWPERSWA